MWKYIITYCIVTINPGPCDKKWCTTDHQNKRLECLNRKEFTNADTARTAYKAFKAAESLPEFIRPYEMVSIDSVKIK